MKPIKYVFVILLAGMLALSACKKGSQATISNITLTINGTTYRSKSVTQSHSQYAVNMRGSFSDTSGVVMVTGNLKVGTFDVSQIATRIIFFNGAKPENGYISSYGTITITSYTNTNLVGTFNTMADNTVAGAVTGPPVPMDGSFNIDLTK